MSAILTLAGLTIREALRRRITLGAFVIGLLFVGLLYLPHTGSRGRHGIELSPELQAELLTRFGIGMIKFFSAVLGIALASGAVSTELERGTLHAILSKPLHRFTVIAGKWLGLVTIVLTNVLIWALLVWWAVRTRDPGLHLPVIKALALTSVYPLMFLTLGLWFSTFASGVLGTSLCVVAVGVGWQEGFMRELGRAFDLHLLERFASVASYLVPIGRLHRWISHVADFQLPFGFGPGERSAPDAVPFDLIYVALYITATFVLATLTFQRRDI
jgi:ABC-type transport system involved in multi-copper enzyme maturation permease subunit